MLALATARVPCPCDSRNWGDKFNCKYSAMICGCAGGVVQAERTAMSRARPASRSYQTTASYRFNGAKIINA
jgi:hypothetical protein